MPATILSAPLVSSPEEITDAGSSAVLAKFPLTAGRHRNPVSSLSDGLNPGKSSIADLSYVLNPSSSLADDSHDVRVVDITQDAVLGHAGAVSSGMATTTIPPSLTIYQAITSLTDL